MAKQKESSALTAGATLPCRIHCHTILPQKMMQGQKLLGLSIYLLWLQAQMPLDRVSDETNKAINRRRRWEASETKAPPQVLPLARSTGPAPAPSKAKGVCRHLWVSAGRSEGWELLLGVPPLIPHLQTHRRLCFLSQQPSESRRSEGAEGFC